MIKLHIYKYMGNILNYMSRFIETYYPSSHKGMLLLWYRPTTINILNVGFFLNRIFSQLTWLPSCVCDNTMYIYQYSVKHFSQELYQMQSESFITWIPPEKKKTVYLKLTRNLYVQYLSYLITLYIWYL